jgi:nuclear-control-of-ATPase protein 2
LVTYAGVFLVRNSRLSGSTNLDDWAASAAEVVRGAFGDHIVLPLLTVRDELFSTFRE